MRRFPKFWFIVLFVLMVGWLSVSYTVDAAPMHRNLLQENKLYYFPIFYLDVQTSAALEEVATGFASPVAMAVPDDGTGRLFIGDQAGQIYIIDSNDNLLSEPFLDLSGQLVAGGERGLLGLAFHPDYATNGRFFVYYSAPLRDGAPSGWDHTSVISEFNVSGGDPDLADPNSEQIILQVDQPQSNHNSGSIAFGYDGYLYIPLGDGGGGSDLGTGHASDWYATNGGGNGQDVEDNMLGSILRIDIDNGDPYAIPPDNPDVSTNFPEIWAYGFRNPYRIAFDPGGTHELFAGDAGQNLWEEASIVTAGGNYGWNVKEGTHCFSSADPGNPDAITSCPDQDPEGDPLIDPIIEFPNHDNPDGGFATTVIGGVVYRGGEVATWEGNYFFGNWSKNYQPDGDVFIGIRPDTETGELWEYRAIEFRNTPDGGLNQYLLGFGQDIDGRIYLLTSGETGLSGSSGTVFRLVP